jgi:three-Cys-motif partner protein
MQVILLEVVNHLTIGSWSAKRTAGAHNEMADQEIKGADGLTLRSSGIWVKEKLYYLEHYLDIFSVGMKKKWAGKLYYVDLFAGPGRCAIRENGEEIDGSPLVALKFDFEKYYFFEADPQCYSALEKRVRSFAPHKKDKVALIPGDCNDKIGEVSPTSSSLGLAFIDPTGLSPFRFETLRKLTANMKLDLIINFHEGMGIRMNMHQYIAKEDSALDAFIGSSRWREDTEESPASLDRTCQTITKEYRENLKHLGYEILDGSQVPIRTQSNTLLYYLLFASKDPKGNEFWQKIGAIGPHGQRKLFP